MLTTLPSGASWVQIGGLNTYDTGQGTTETGGFDGQTSGPYQDTSFGVTNEPGTPWFTGNDQSAQQFVQTQVFGDSGTNSPPGPSGARFYNGGDTVGDGTGFTGPATVNSPSAPTNEGANFPSTAVEERQVSLTDWNNTNPDVASAGTVGQQVFVPTSATLTLGLGWGSDEMQMAVIGGTSGATSEMRVDLNLYGMWDSNLDAATNAATLFGYAGADRNLINMNAIMEVNDAGDGNEYGLDGVSGVPWGYGNGGSANLVNFGRDSTTDQVMVGGAYLQEPGQGIPGNSVGHFTQQAYNVLGSVGGGAMFTNDFRSEAEIFLSRNFGNADARVSTGPGMQGYAQLVVEYEVWEIAAVPEPSRAVLLLGGLLAAGLRRWRA